MKTEIKKNIKNVEIIVNYEVRVTDVIAYADGDNIKMGEESCTLASISVTKGDQSIGTNDLSFFYKIDAEKTRVVDGESVNIYPKGAFARLGDSYISKEVFLLITEALGEAKTACGELETKPDEPKYNHVNTVKKGAGWCDRCGSYCYGDCQF